MMGWIYVHDIQLWLRTAGVLVYKFPPLCYTLFLLAFFAPMV